MISVDKMSDYQKSIELYNQIKGKDAKDLEGLTRGDRKIISIALNNLVRDEKEAILQADFLSVFRHLKNSNSPKLGVFQRLLVTLENIFHSRISPVEIFEQKEKIKEENRLDQIKVTHAVQAETTLKNDLEILKNKQKILDFPYAVSPSDLQRHEEEIILFSKMEQFRINELEITKKEINSLETDIKIMGDKTKRLVDKIKIYNARSLSRLALIPTEQKRLIQSSQDLKAERSFLDEQKRMYSKLSNSLKAKELGSEFRSEIVKSIQTEIKKEEVKDTLQRSILLLNSEDFSEGTKATLLSYVTGALDKIERAIGKLAELQDLVQADLLRLKDEDKRIKDDLPKLDN